MLIETTPTRRVSQAPLKETVCFGGCGVAVFYRTNPRVCCSTCSRNRTLERARCSMERVRRRRGVPRVKGRLINCIRCAAIVELNRNVSTRYCAPCKIETDRQQARAASRRKAATSAGREESNAWRRRKAAADPAYRVSSHMKVVIHRALGKAKAGRSWRQLVPYSLDELMAHLERQFLPGMSWENKGKWHIDHIVPLASFKFETPSDDGFQAAWALSNLRPLWGRDNIRKSAKRLYLL
jgi:hypothetical protein